MARGWLGGIGVVVAALFSIAATKPFYGPGPVFEAGSVRNVEFGFAFDVPPGWRAELGVGRDFYWIGPAGGGAPLKLWIETRRSSPPIHARPPTLDTGGTGNGPSGRPPSSNARTVEGPPAISDT